MDAAVTAKRQRRKIVTKAQFNRAADFLQRMGTAPVAVEFEDNRVRILTDAGKQLTLAPADREGRRLTDFDE